MKAFEATRMIKKPSPGESDAQRRERENAHLRASPIRIDMTRSDVFMDTPKQRPMRKPEIRARRIVNAPLSNTAMHNNQTGAQRLSVRNSTEQKA
jgi:hypothetical protein